MSSLGAFARTRVVRAGALKPVAADKVKWWAKMTPNDGEVSCPLRLLRVSVFR